MKILELIYREILFQAIEKGNRRFVQKELAALFDCSLSTVFHALSAPRRMGAVRIGGRFGEVVDVKKLLLYWATRRRLAQAVLCEVRTSLSALELEGQMPPDVVYGAFSAYRLRFRTAPADYDHVYVYSNDAEPLRKRFPPGRNASRLTVLASDPYLPRYGKLTTLAQTFVDLWNLPQWYARDFADAILEGLP